MALAYCLTFKDMFTDFLTREDLIKFKNINNKFYHTVEELYRSERWRKSRVYCRIDLITDIIYIRNCIRGIYENNENISVYPKGRYLSDGPCNRCQTLNGYFIVEKYYSSFAYLHTPMGFILLDGMFSSFSGAHISAGANIIEKLGLVLIKEEYFDSMGNHGPWYLVTKINGVDLDVEVKNTKSEYYEEDKNKLLSYRQCKDAFKPVLKILNL